MKLEDTLEVEYCPECGEAMEIEFEEGIEVHYCSCGYYSEKFGSRWIN